MSYTISPECIGCGACVRVCPTDAISGEKKEHHVIDPALCIECGACGRICPKSCVLDDRGDTVEKVKKSEWLRPVINADKCYACENCVQGCPTGALAMLDENLPLTENRALLAFPEKCVSCGWCLRNCLFEAITMEVLPAEVKA